MLLRRPFSRRAARVGGRTLLRRMSGVTRGPVEPIRAVVFDKDGTLLDAHATWAAPVRAACAGLLEAGAAGALDGAQLRALLGLDDGTGRFRHDATFMLDSNEVVRAHLAAAGVDAALFQRLLDGACAAPAFRIAHLAGVDAAGLFAALRGAGLLVGVLTSDDRANALAFLADCDGGEGGGQGGGEGGGLRVDALVCGDDGRGFKPDAAPLLAAAADLGVPVHSVLMVGDSTHDVRCGAAAGAPTLGVLTGVGDAAGLRAADALLPSVSEMLTDKAFQERWLPGLL